MTTANTIAVQGEWINIIPIFFCQIGQKLIYFLVCLGIFIISLRVPRDEEGWKLLSGAAVESAYFMMGFNLTSWKGAAVIAAKCILLHLDFHLRSTGDDQRGLQTILLHWAFSKERVLSLNSQGCGAPTILELFPKVKDPYPSSGAPWVTVHKPLHCPFTCGNNNINKATSIPVHLMCAVFSGFEVFADSSFP